MMLTKKDYTFFAYLFIGFAIFIYGVVPYLMQSAQQNFSYTYIFFVLGYSIFLIKFLGIKLDINDVLGISMIFLAGDIIIPPLLVTPQGIVENLPSQARLSSDIFIYSLLPAALPVDVKYFLTYVAIPVLLLFAARQLLGRGTFKRSLF